MDLSFNQELPDEDSDEISSDDEKDIDKVSCALNILV